MIAMILAIGLVKIEVILSIYRLLIIMLKHSKNGIKTYPIKDKIIPNILERVKSND